MTVNQISSNLLILMVPPTEEDMEDFQEFPDEEGEENMSDL